ncbi:hemerythrin domain-containing protein [Thauera sp. 2A1]|uniref:hemerythrin domain-containing protein n=1 Tax=Thauera sp. 2A1 TaxID=2570191 RepID=UPI00129156D2|nr:hemerythrin domain-containing protein [Thauera sp. 2A1]KAI5915444.1 hemerythrin domain-containing protein [Thauera sp. 2A1]
MKKSLSIIHDEHRAIAAMMHGLRQIVAGIEAGRLKPDFALFRDMVEYIDKVPERVHHPKEDQYLFARLRTRCADALPVIEALEAEHRIGDARIRALETAMQQYEQAGQAGFAGFKAAVNEYVEAEWKHMNREEHEVFPLAEKHLADEDWTAIDAAFLSNQNPWQGEAGQYQKLFSKIVNIAPAPVGLGPS